MAGPSPRTKQHVDRDGVRTIEVSGVRRSVWLLAVAIALVGVALFVVVRPALQQARTPPAGPRTSDLAANVPAPHVTAGVPQPPPAPIQPRPPREPASALQQHREALPRQPAPASEATPAAPNEGDAAPESDEPVGIALFPPPGTKPIKRGIVVPDDFELPPGYVRHYQTTDDGRQLPAILMFHPDYQPVDERGEPIPLPDDRVVPPEMAPDRLPVQILEVPENGAVEMDVPERGGRKRSP